MKHFFKTLTLLTLSATILLSLFPTTAKAETTSAPEGGQVVESRSNDGWKNVDGKWYYYVNGVKQTGWIGLEAWYYLDANGVMQTGWQHLDGAWYYLNASGAMVTDWQAIDGAWYYFNISGVMQTGWINLNNVWYYLNTNGAMLTDWQQISGKWYYFNESGAMQTGWIKGAANKYYFLQSSGEMAVSQTVDNNQYYVDASGAWYDTSAQRVIDMACRQLGKSYVYGATGPNSFDCSGLTQYSYKQALGIDISRTTYTQINKGVAVSRANLRPGDLVFPHTGHVQIYIGDGKVIHAPHTGDVVKIVPLGNFYTARRIV